MTVPKTVAEWKRGAKEAAVLTEAVLVVQEVHQVPQLIILEQMVLTLYFLALHQQVVVAVALTAQD
jgi:hypothetical protein